MILTDDLSTLTTISKSTFRSLMQKSFLLISHYIREAIQDNKSLVEIDIGIGTLYISIVEDNIKYKFIPSCALEKTIKQTLQEDESLLIQAIDAKLKDSIENTYKELL